MHQIRYIVLKSKTIWLDLLGINKYKIVEKTWLFLFTSPCTIELLKTLQIFTGTTPSVCLFHTRAPLNCSPGRATWFLAAALLCDKSLGSCEPSSLARVHRKDLSLLIVEQLAMWQVMTCKGGGDDWTEPLFSRTVSIHAGALIHWPLALKFVIAHF